MLAVVAVRRADVADAADAVGKTMSFWDGLANFFYSINRPIGYKAGRESDARWFGWKFVCPWPECGFSLRKEWAAENFVKECPACGRPIWWANEGTEPRRRETNVERSG